MKCRDGDAARRRRREKRAARCESPCHRGSLSPSRLPFTLHPSSFILNYMNHTLSIVVADQPGELSRIVGLFSARGFNIETISVGATLDPRWARVTIVTRGADRTIEQIVKQCERLARVREVQDVTTRPHIEREMALITVNAAPGLERQEILGLVQVFRAKVVDISHTQMIVEASGNKEKVESFIDLLRPLG